MSKNFKSVGVDLAHLTAEDYDRVRRFAESKKEPEPEPERLECTSQPSA